MESGIAEVRQVQDPVRLSRLTECFILQTRTEFQKTEVICSASPSSSRPDTSWVQKLGFLTQRLFLMLGTNILSENIGIQTKP